MVQTDSRTAMASRVSAVIVLVYTFIQDRLSVSANLTIYVQTKQFKSYFFRILYPFLFFKSFFKTYNINLNAGKDENFVQHFL